MQYMGDNGQENGNYSGILGLYLGGCQNYGPLLDPYYNTAPNIWGTQKGTTHIAVLEGPVLGLHVCLVESLES